MKTVELTLKMVIITNATMYMQIKNTVFRHFMYTVQLIHGCVVVYFVHIV